MDEITNRLELFLLFLKHTPVADQVWQKEKHPGQWYTSCTDRRLELEIDMGLFDPYCRSLFSLSQSPTSLKVPDKVLCRTIGSL
jgi:hypothetical protein